MEDLRPIGTEFDVGFLPSMSGTSSCFKVIRYRVIDHHQSQRIDGINESFKFDGKPIGEPYMAEGIEAVDIKKYQPIRWEVVHGHLLPVPPAEIAHLFQ